MPDTALKNAQARRDALASQINQLNQQLHDLQSEIRRIDQWIGLWHSFAEDGGVGASTNASSGEQSTNGSNVAAEVAVDSDRSDRTRTTGNPKKETVAEAARTIIEAAGMPVSRSDLYIELRDMGIVVEGKDPEQVLSTMMWRTRDYMNITRLPSGGYWLAERPHEASGYEPRRPINAVDQIFHAPAEEHGPPEDISDLSKDEAGERHGDLSAQIADADRLYHGEDAPDTSDAEYDALRRELEAIEARFPDLTGAGEASASLDNETPQSSRLPEDATDETLPRAPLRRLPAPSRPPEDAQ